VGNRSEILLEKDVSHSGSCSLERTALTLTFRKGLYFIVITATAVTLPVLMGSLGDGPYTEPS